MNDRFVRRVLTFVGIVLITGLLVVIVARIYPILIIGLLSWIIATGLSIPVNALRRRGLRRGRAVLVTLLGTLVVLVLFGVLLLPPLIGQINGLLNQLPAAGETFVTEYERLRGENETLAGLLPPFTMADYEALFSGGDGERPMIDTGSIAQSALPVLVNIGGRLGGILVNLFLITFLTIYFLIEPLIYYRIILALIPPEREARILNIINQIRDAIVSWLGAMVLEVTITAIMVTVAMALLGLPNAIALGSLAGLGNIVPYIGYWVALLPIVIIALATGGPLLALVAFAVYFVIGIVEANVILPANIGSKLKLPAALVLLGQAAAGALLGFWGVLLAVPLLAMIMVLVREMFVYDALGKRGRVPRVAELPTGEVVLEGPPLESVTASVEIPQADA